MTATDAPAAVPAAGPEVEDIALDELATAMIELMHTYGSIKAKVTGPQADANPVFLLAKLVHDGPRRSGELAAHLCADPSTVSRQVATLVKQGLVERKADPEDGRASLLVPTPSGVDRVERHRRRRGRAIAPVVSDWAPEDVAQLARLLRRYIVGLDDHRDAIVANMAGHVSAAEHDHADDDQADHTWGDHR